MKEFTLMLTRRNILRVEAESSDDAIQKCWDVLVAQGQIKTTDPVSIELVEEVEEISQ